jgi:DNA-directed RNA polymerase subunit N (RpoN/RPB10)
MYPYITCNCGNSIGDKYNAFKTLRQKEYEKHFKETGKYIDPVKLQYSESVKISLTGVFEALKITHQCCKIRLMTQVEYKNIY